MTRLFIDRVKTFLGSPLIVSTLLGLFVGQAHDLASAQAVEKFESVQVYFEQNLRDKDAEVKFDAVGTQEGLASLVVTAPDGRVVVDFKTGNSKLGIRHFSLESPEPKNDGRLQKDFPAGVYKFAGTTVTGVKLEGQATLVHQFPAPVALMRPRADEIGVPHKGLKIRWSPVKGIATTVLVIEHEKSGRSLRVSLSGDSRVFAVPDGFLIPGTEYKVAIGTVAPEGNASFIETMFTTSGSARAKAGAGTKSD
jgi:hypothetical protein